jgi:hypothetical protein
MMFNKISLITSLLFFLLGTNVLANSRLELYSPQSSRLLSQTAQMITLTTVNNKIVSTNDKTVKTMEQSSLLSKHIKDTKPSFKNYVIPGLVGLIFIAGFGSYWLVFRRKHS